MSNKVETILLINSNNFFFFFAFAFFAFMLSQIYIEVFQGIHDVYDITTLTTKEASLCLLFSFKSFSGFISIQ